MILAHPLWLLLLVLVPLPWLIARHKGYVGFPDTSRITPSRGGWLLHVIPVLLLVAGFATLSIALARPQKLHVISTQSFKSRDILIGVDISGSMAAQFGKPPESVVGQTELDKDFPGRPDRTGKNAQQDPYSYSRIGERRIDNAQAATLDFIRNRYLAKARRPGRSVRVRHGPILALAADPRPEDDSSQGALCRRRSRWWHQLRRVPSRSNRRGCRASRRHGSGPTRAS